jgi:chorismate dehydratase
VFDQEGRFKYSFDLGAAWKKLTGLPFAFAVFVSKYSLPNDISLDLNHALKAGVENIDNLDLSQINIPHINDYLKNNISYRFDKQKFIAMKQYFEFAHNLIES